MASVLVPLAPGFEELEAITIIDLLVRAGIEVVSAGLVPGPVKASRGVVVTPDMALDEALKQTFDMVVLPGGQPGADHLDSDPRIQQLLKKMSANGKYTAAICAAPKVLANLGLLEGKMATSYPGTFDKIELNNSQISQQNVVTDGNVITSRGPGTAMEFALVLIETLVGRGKRDEVAKGLLYDH
ncbi:MAG TPA: DJ-1/PfpI family protein [Ectothiorhodospiraceae bacterium]|nr:DJ-1/PfpI family protein [Ectothiorhodospiraceae bacterium]